MASAIVASLLDSPSVAPLVVTSDPISAARRGRFDRQAVRDYLSAAVADHTARRPELVRKMDAARKAADRARAAADQLAAAARDAEEAVAAIDQRLAHTKTRTEGVFASNAPARLIEVRDTLREHSRTLNNEPFPRTDEGIRSRGRRMSAIAEAIERLDELTRSGIDGNRLELEIGRLVKGIDAAEVTEPPPPPTLPPEVKQLRWAVVDRRMKVLAKPSPTTADRVTALLDAERELTELRPGDADVMAKVRAISELVRVPIPVRPQPHRPRRLEYIVVGAADDE